VRGCGGAVASPSVERLAVCGACAGICDAGDDAATPLSYSYYFTGAMTLSCDGRTLPLCRAAHSKGEPSSVLK